MNNFQSLDANHKHALACSGLMMDLMADAIASAMGVTRDIARYTFMKEATKIVKGEDPEDWQKIEKFIQEWDEFLESRVINR
jgi:hypothetical protein